MVSMIQVITSIQSPSRFNPPFATVPTTSASARPAPPYDKPLRGIQVILRVFEHDSRQIRQVSVDQHFVPE